ncbi:MAG TPA: hypothetical protein VJP82_07420 [Sphingomicrobium sp.]|jgi:tetratricopeptide (TPR) repeat protein|nr:hypothetical protein [Sphingomicrobium sp.]
MRKIVKLLAAVCALAQAGSASAEWHKASSKHFVIYADKSPEDLRTFATKLEEFNAAVREARGIQDVPPGTSTRVTLYVLPSLKALQKLGGEGVAGFYMAKMSGPVAFIPATVEKGRNSQWDMSSEGVFFHEYTHHLMLEDSDVPMPTWVSEGSAEFFATPKFNEDGSVTIGTPPFWRAEELYSIEGLPIETIVGGDYEYLTSMEFGSIYGRGWLLIHYLAFNPARQGQLVAYLDAIRAGTPAKDAAQKAFGDLKVLDRELAAYFKSKSFATATIPASKLSVPPISIVKLSDPEAELMDARIKLAKGGDDIITGPLARKAKAIAEANPNDSDLLVFASQAASADEDHDAALALAARALTINPRSYEAQVAKAKAMFGLAVKSPTTAKWDAVRTELSLANRLDPESAEPLVLFYRTFEQQRIPATKNALDGLAYAVTLAPQNTKVRIELVSSLIASNRWADARTALEPVAYSPHRGKWRDKLTALLNSIIARDPAKATADLAAVEKFTRDWEE